MNRQEILTEYHQDELEINQQQSLQLGIKNKLTVVYVLSIMIGVLVILVSSVGMIYSTSIYLSNDISGAFLPTDYLNLIIGVPFLLIAMLLVKSKKIIGLISWCGALFYMIYVYIPYVISVPFGPLFLPYLLIVVLSLYTLIGLLTTIDHQVVKEKMSGRVSRKIIAGILAGLGSLIVIRQVAMILTALTTKSQVNMQELSIWIDDFIVAVPSLLISSFLMLKKRPLGYVICGGMLLTYGILSLELVPIMIYQAELANTAIDIAGIVVVIVMTLICLIPYGFIVSGISSKGTVKEIS